MVSHAGPLDLLLSAVQVEAGSSAVFRQCSVVEERLHGCPPKESRALGPWCVCLRSHLGDSGDKPLGACLHVTGKKHQFP